MNAEEMNQKLVDLQSKKWRTIKTKKSCRPVAVYFDRYHQREEILWLVKEKTMLIEDGETPGTTSISHETIEEVLPYSDWPIDSKVYVWNVESFVFNRHFAGVSSEGKPMAWERGLTSFTGEEKKVWNHAKLSEDEK